MQDNTQTLVVVEEESITFIRKSGELTKLLKRVDKITPDAVAFLEKTMNDATVDIKTRVACAKEIVGINIDVAKTVNHDQLSRLIAQLKLKTGSGKTLVDKDEMPSLDFETVQTF